MGRLRDLGATDALADQARRVEVAAEAALSTLKEAETGQRGFPLTGDRAAARIRADGPPVPTRPKATISFAMALHELATNAAKHGALSGEAGRADLSWGLADGRLRLSWRESGGPPVTPPARRGFGSRLVERGHAAELRGRTALRFEPAGLVCEVDTPAPAEASVHAG